MFVFFLGTGKPCKRGKHKSRNRKQICFHEAEQSLFSNMACVTVCLLEKTGTKSTPVRMMPPSGPGISQSRAQSLGISPKAPNLECTESAHAVFPSFWYQTCNTFFHIGLGRDRRRNSKREGKVFSFCRSYRIFGPDSFFLSISTYPRIFARKRLQGLQLTKSAMIFVFVIWVSFLRFLR